MTLLEQVAGYALSLNSSAISPQAKALGKAFFIDCLACIIAGAHGQPSRIALAYSEAMYGSTVKTATVMAAGKKLSSAAAAFVNGISSHFHDYDDVLPTLNGHPSAAVLPAVMALCEELDKSGEDALCAYIAGVEIVDIMARGLNQEGHIHYSRGWHSTQSLGIFGSAAAAGILLGLDQAQMTCALSMAASESSGLQGNFGTMTKAFHAGRAAEKGILCARMARMGFTANPDILTMEGGFAGATTGEIDANAMTRRMESRVSVFVEPGLTMKPYPCCKCCHNIIDGVWNLMTRHGFEAGEVEKVRIGAQPFFLGCLKYPIPKTALEGKFSANYTAALTLLNRRRPGISDFEGDVDDPRLIETMHRVEMIRDDSIAGGRYANGGWDTKVEIALKDSRVLKDRVVYSRGESKNPLTTEEVLEKLRDCMAVTLEPAKSQTVSRLLADLETLPRFRELADAVTAAARPMQTER